MCVRSLPLGASEKLTKIISRELALKAEDVSNFFYVCVLAQCSDKEEKRFLPALNLYVTSSRLFFPEETLLA